MFTAHNVDSDWTDPESESSTSPPEHFPILFGDGRVAGRYAGENRPGTESPLPSCLIVATASQREVVRGCRDFHTIWNKRVSLSVSFSLCVSFYVSLSLCPVSLALSLSLIYIYVYILDSLWVTLTVRLSVYLIQMQILFRLATETDILLLCIPSLFLSHSVSHNPFIYIAIIISFYLCFKSIMKVFLPFSLSLFLSRFLICEGDFWYSNLTLSRFPTNLL